MSDAARIVLTLYMYVLPTVGRKAKYVGRYRITDSDSLKAAMEAAGTVQYAIQSKLSPGPPILSLRRHGHNSRWHDVGVRVVSGNFLAAKVSSAFSQICYAMSHSFPEIKSAIFSFH